MGSFTGAIESLSPDPTVRGRQFEYLCEWLLTNDPLYAHELARVWRWDDWPGRWGRDAGIDLVAKDRQGGLWAIEAKAYDEKYSVKKSDIEPAPILGRTLRTVPGIPCRPCAVGLS